MVLVRSRRLRRRLSRRLRAEEEAGEETEEEAWAMVRGLETGRGSPSQAGLFRCLFCNRVPTDEVFEGRGE